MGLNPSEWIWYSGKWVRWEDATVHLTAHALHYGSSVFEGIRAYETPEGPAAFRLDCHVRRLFESCKIARIDLAGYTPEQVREACMEGVVRNRHQACYIRPLAFRGSGSLGLNPLRSPVEFVIFTVEWGTYLGAEALENGVDAGVSSWRRIMSSSLAPLAKIGGQYVNSQFVSMEARANGFTEGITLDLQGHVCEGPGENLFVVHRGDLITPPIGSSILSGITRDTAVTLARDLGLEVRFEEIAREMLYICDEIFMTGTAAEITPVRSVDRMPIGDGKPGPITMRLQSEFFRIVKGEIPDRHRWLTLATTPKPTHFV